MKKRFFILIVLAMVFLSACAKAQPESEEIPTISALSEDASVINLYGKEEISFSDLTPYESVDFDKDHRYEIHKMEPKPIFMEKTLEDALHDPDHADKIFNVTISLTHRYESYLESNSERYPGTYASWMEDYYRNGFHQVDFFYDLIYKNGFSLFPQTPTSYEPPDRVEWIRNTFDAVDSGEYREIAKKFWAVHSALKEDYNALMAAYTDEQEKLKELGIETLIYEPRDCGIVLRAFMSKAQLLAYPYDDRFGYVFMWDAYNEDFPFPMPELPELPDWRIVEGANNVEINEDKVILEVDAEKDTGIGYTKSKDPLHRYLDGEYLYSVKVGIGKEPKEYIPYRGKTYQERYASEDYVTLMKLEEWWYEFFPEDQDMNEWVKQNLGEDFYFRCQKLKYDMNKTNRLIEELQWMDYPLLRRIEYEMVKWEVKTLREMGIYAELPALFTTIHELEIDGPFTKQQLLYLYHQGYHVY